jgi:hypothetical protein
MVDAHGNYLHGDIRVTNKESYKLQGATAVVRRLSSAIISSPSALTYFNLNLNLSLNLNLRTKGPKLRSALFLA